MISLETMLLNRVFCNVEKDLFPCRHLSFSESVSFIFAHKYRSISIWYNYYHI